LFPKSAIRILSEIPHTALASPYHPGSFQYLKLKSQIPRIQSASPRMSMEPGPQKIPDALSGRIFPLLAGIVMIF
jgi:hypothetical protein